MGWAGWIREVERNRDVLERILALLLALAELADRASGLPAFHRLHVLRILGRGEVEARAFVTGMAFGPPGGAAEIASPAADHAARLAASFRALALMLGAMLAQAGRFARRFRREAGRRASRQGSSSRPKRKTAAFAALRVVPRRRAPRVLPVAWNRRPDPLLAASGGEAIEP